MTILPPKTATERSHPEPGSQRAPFDWLAEHGSRRGAFQMIRSAIARGWLDGSGPELAARRDRLVEALSDLVKDPSITAREFIQIARIFGAMDRRNLETRWRASRLRRPL
jgi:hypothetical protein